MTPVGVDLRPLFDRDSTPAVMREMSLELGTATISRVLGSSFVADLDSPWAAEMHKRFNHPTGERFQGFATLVEITAPPTGWEILARWSRQVAAQMKVGDREGDRHERRAWARLSIKVETELTRLAAHPAYHGSSVLGVEPMILPAFRLSDCDDPEQMPPRPTPNLAMKAVEWAQGEIEAGVMHPYAYVVRGETYTCWCWEPESATE